MTRRDRKSRPLVPDWHLWSDVKRSVVPLRPDRRIGAPSVADPAPEPGTPPPAAAIRRLSEDVWPPRKTAPGSARSPNPPPEAAIEPRIRRRVVRGQLPIDASIDLHGMRQTEAHAALRRFIEARHARGDRTLLVITGKGLKQTGDDAAERRGVLRAMLPVWLANADLAPLVVGWQASARAHGGEGAYYVRLRRAK